MYNDFNTLIHLSLSEDVFENFYLNCIEDNL